MPFPPHPSFTHTHIHTHSHAHASAHAHAAAGKYYSIVKALRFLLVYAVCEIALSFYNGHSSVYQTAIDTGVLALSARNFLLFLSFLKKFEFTIGSLWYLETPLVFLGIWLGILLFPKLFQAQQPTLTGNGSKLPRRQCGPWAASVLPAR